MFKSRYLALAAALAIGFASSVWAQVIVLPQQQSLQQTDLIQIIPNGQPNAQSAFAPVGGAQGIEQYSYQIPLTGFTITPANYIAYLYLNPAGTLATGTLTMPATPGDGQRFCLQDTQTQTAITIQANTGQTLAAGTFGLATPTALVANTKYCWLYIRSLATWTRTS